MVRTHPFVRVVLAASLLTGGLALTASACSSRPSDEVAEEPAIAVTVHIVDGEFEPREVEIEPGGSVQWINDDVTVHRLGFLEARLDSGNLGAGHSWIHTFTTEGEYLYYDVYRNTMKGSVVVRAPS